jgi:glycosyltransferase involved in cell wall biosynthesis
MQVAGAEVLIEQTIQTLSNRIEPTIFCLDAIGLIGERLLAKGVPVICLNRKQGKRDLSVSWRMAREIRTRQIQVVHAHQYTPFFYSALAKLSLGTRFKLIFTEHGRHYPDVVSRVRRLVNRLVLSRFADAVNACCDFSAQAVIEKDGFPRWQMEVIDNGIDLAPYRDSRSKSEIRQNLGLDPDRKYLTTIARFHPVKDHAMLLRGFAPVAHASTNVELLLAGDGPLKPQLQELCRELGIESRVRFLGIRNDVPELLKACDLFCLTSVSEAASLTLMEAMAASLPVIVTDVGGNPEIVRRGIDGLLVPRGDFVACTQAIQQLLDNEPLAKQMGLNGHRRIVERFQLQHTIARYDQLYHRLVSQGR